MIHPKRQERHNVNDEKELGLPYPKRRALKPEAQAKELTDSPSLARQA